MKKEVIALFLLGILLVLPPTLAQEPSFEHFTEEHIGPSTEDIKCLKDCVSLGCEQEDKDCMMANSKKCEQECNVEPEPEPADEGEACMQVCVKRGCDKFDHSCEQNNKDKCEQECDMIEEPEAENEAEQCMKDCINKIDPNIQCSSGSFEGEGETGNSVCQKCAKSCEHLYSGPCLSDKEWTEKENICYAQCEHCYGEPVRGPSGQGWDCTIDIKCKDASAEFGDDAGTGEDNWEEGHAPSEDNVYWGNYKSDLEFSDSEGILEIRNTNIKNIGKKIKININSGEGVSLEEKEGKLIIKNEEVEVKIDNNLNKLVISEKGNNREIKDINIEIEEGKPIYKYEELEKAKLLGFISIDKKIRKKVDAENMEILEEDGPWWEFLSTEEKEKMLER